MQAASLKKKRNLELQKGREKKIADYSQNGKCEPTADSYHRRLFKNASG